MINSINTNLRNKVKRNPAAFLLKKQDPLVNKGSCFAKSLFQFEAIPECFANALCYPVITVCVGVKGNGVHQGHVNFAVHHYTLIRRDIDDLSDHAAAVFAALVLHEFTFQTQWEFVDDRGVNRFRFAGGKPTACKLVRDSVSGFNTKVVRFRYVSNIRNTYGESAACFDVLYGFMRFGQIESHHISFLHGSPSGIHDIDAAIFIISCDHQDGHGEDTLGDIHLFSHNNYLFSLIKLTGWLILNTIISGIENNSSTGILEMYYPKGKCIMIKNYIENANFEDTGFSYSLSLISGKHKMVILYCLMEFKAVRFNELKRYLKTISDKTLSTNLKELEADHLIVRTEYPQIPPKVEYSLSDRGKSLMAVLDQLCVWGESNRLARR